MIARRQDIQDIHYLDNHAHHAAWPIMPILFFVIKVRAVRRNRECGLILNYLYVARL